MNGPVDDLLRETVRQLAGEARPASDLVTGALVRGRRLRRRRRAGMVAAAAVLILVTALPYAFLRQTAQRLPATTTPTASASPSVRALAWSQRRLYELPGGQVITGLSNEARSSVFDDRIGGYRRLTKAYQNVWVSPGGRYAAVTDDEHQGQIGLLDIPSDKIRWKTADYTLSPQWSPDGGRLLVTGLDSFSVLTAATGGIERHPVDRSRYFCSDYCLYTWLGNGTQVALALTTGNTSEAEAAPVTGLAIFDAATGSAIRTVPVPGAPLGTDSWSPDGGLVVIRAAGAAREEVRVAEVTSGRIRATIPGNDVRFVGTDRLLAISDGAAQLFDSRGRLLETLRLAPELRGYALSLGPRR